MQLKEEGFSSNEIGKILGISPRRVRYWAERKYPPSSQLVPNLEPSPHLAYVIGVYFGDGWIQYKRQAKGYYLGLSVKNRTFAEAFAEALRLVCSRRPYMNYDKRGYYRVTIGSKLLCEFLKQDFERLRPTIEAYAPDFLRGLFDSDGFCYFYFDSRKYPIFGICVKNAEEEVIKTAQILLKRLGIEVNLRRIDDRGKVLRTPNGLTMVKQVLFQLTICQQRSIIIFANKIGFTVPKRAAKLNLMVDYINKQGVRKRGYNQFSLKP